MRQVPHETTHPRDAQNVIRVVGLDHSSGRDNDQIYHPCHYCVSKNDSDNALDSALLAQALALLRVNEIGMFRFEVGLDAGGGVLEFCEQNQLVRYLEWKSKFHRVGLTFARSEEVIGEREGNQAGQGEDEEGEELTLHAMSIFLILRQVDSILTCSS